MSLEPAMRKLPADPQRAGVCDIMQVGGPKDTSDVYRPLGVSRVAPMLPRRTYGEHSEPKITRMFCFEMTQLPASRLRRFKGAGSP